MRDRFLKGLLGVFFSLWVCLGGQAYTEEYPPEKLLQWIRNGKFIELDTAAKELLEEDPENPWGWYTRGMTEWKAYGQLAESYYAFSQASDNLQGSVPQVEQLTQSLMLAQAMLAGDLGDFIRQELLLKKYRKKFEDESYFPYEAWAWYKQGDYEQASALFLDQEGLSGIQSQPSWNAMRSAIAYEERDFSMAQDLCDSTIQIVREGYVAPAPVYWMNRARLLWAQSDFELARQDLIQATQLFYSESVDNPFPFLAVQDIWQGQGASVRDWLIEAQKWQGSILPYLRIQRGYVTQARVAATLLLAGQVEAAGKAWEEIKPSLGRQSRSAGNHKDYMTAYRLLNHALVRLEIEELEHEICSESNLVNQTQLYGELAQLKMSQGWLNSVLAFTWYQLEDPLSLDPFAAGSLYTPWLSLEWYHIFEPEQVQQKFQSARENDKADSWVWDWMSGRASDSLIAEGRKVEHWLADDPVPQPMDNRGWYRWTQKKVPLASSSPLKNKNPVLWNSLIELSRWEETDQGWKVEFTEEGAWSFEQDGVQREVAAGEESALGLYQAFFEPHFSLSKTQEIKVTTPFVE